MNKIKLKENHLKLNSFNYIIDYLGTLGVSSSDAMSFINKPRDLDQEDPFNLDNMLDAVKMVATMARGGFKFFVQVDADTDGFTSSAILIRYLRLRFPSIDIMWRLHNGKEHGVILDTVPADRTVVIIPDAGSNQFDEQAALVQTGHKVIILDHHEIDKNIYRETGAIIINNQTSKKFHNKNLSGAGVVYKFIQAMDKYIFNGEDYATQFADLASIGIIADAMNMLQLDNNFIAYYGLNNIKNKFIQELAVKQAHGIKNPEHLTKIDVAFYIAPVINGVIRSGSTEDKEMVFKAMLQEGDDQDYTSTWRGKERHETLYEYAARLAVNAKGRQDASKKKSFEWMCNKIRTEGWDNNNIIIVPLTEQEGLKVSPTITGLIAMELVKEFNKPALVLRETEMDGIKVFSGSGRNGNFYGLADLKQALVDSKSVYFAEGHANAFGVAVEPRHIEDVRKYFNDNYSAETFEDKVYEVDYWFHTDQKIEQAMLFDLAKYDFLYGNSIPQPKIACSFNFSASDVRYMGSNNSSIKLTHDGVAFVAFSDEKLAAKLAQIDQGHATIVGRPQLNEWNGITTVQMMIDDIELTSTNEIKISAPKSLFDLI